MDILTLVDKRNNLMDEAEKFLNEKTDKDGKMSEADKKIYSKMLVDIDVVTQNIERFQRRNGGNKEPIYPELKNNVGGDFVKHSTAKSFGLSGKNYHKKFFDEVRGGFQTAHNFLNEGNDGQGGYLCPREFHDEIISELKNENVLRQISRVVETQNDRAIAIQSAPPTAAVVAEGQQIPLSVENFEQKTLKAFKIAAGCSVSDELLQDAYYDVEGHLQIEFGKAVGSLEENLFLNGTGVNEPKGLLTEMSADSTTTIATAGANIAADDIVNLCYALARPYRKNACWLMSDKTLAAVRKLKDSTLNYIWQPQLQDEPSHLLGYPVYTSEYMPEISTGQIPIIFGDFQKFIIGQRGGLQFKALRELHALQGLQTFLLIERIDAVLADVHAIKGLKIQ